MFLHDGASGPINAIRQLMMIARLYVPCILSYLPDGWAYRIQQHVVEGLIAQLHKVHRVCGPGE